MVLKASGSETEIFPWGENMTYLLPKMAKMTVFIISMTATVFVCIY